MSRLAEPAPFDAWAYVAPTPGELAAVAPRLDPGAWAALAARFLAGHPLTIHERAVLIGEIHRARAVRVVELEGGARVGRAD